MVEKVDFIPGNGGTARVLGNVSNVSEVKPDDLSVLVALSSKHNMSLAFPGPEAPLVAGMEEPLVRRASQGLLSTCETDKSEKPV